MEIPNFGSDDWDVSGEGIRFELKLRMTMKEARFYFKGTGFQIISFRKYVVVRGRAIYPERWIEYAKRTKALEDYRILPPNQAGFFTRVGTESVP
jgi:hypothetical protein